MSTFLLIIAQTILAAAFYILGVLQEKDRIRRILSHLDSNTPLYRIQKFLKISAKENH